MCWSHAVREGGERKVGSAATGATFGSLGHPCPHCWGTGHVFSYRSGLLLLDHTQHPGSPSVPRATRCHGQLQALALQHPGPWLLARERQTGHDSQVAAAKQSWWEACSTGKAKAMSCVLSKLLQYGAFSKETPRTIRSPYCAMCPCPHPFSSTHVQARVISK